MVKFSVFIATSLDGYIARPDGSLDWLMEAGSGGGDTDYGYAEFIDSVDLLVMGRNSFEKVLTFGDWPYPKKVIVMSRTLQKVPPELAGRVELFSGSPRALAEKLEGEGIQRVYVDGGQLIQAFLHDGLLSDMIITLIPILIGEGIPLFGPLENDIKLHLIRVEGFESGFVQFKYEVRSTMYD